MGEKICLIRRESYFKVICTSDESKRLAKVIFQNTDLLNLQKKMIRKNVSILASTEHDHLLLRLVETKSQFLFCLIGVT